MTWLLVHLAAVAVLTGVGWVVQLVVYPAFLLVGEPEWARYHRRHQQAISLVVFPPWLLQAVSLVALAVGSGPTAPVVMALGVLALATVGLTVFGAVPAHGRLADRRDATGQRALLRANLARTLAWTASTAVAGIALAAA